jgi:hypothetical protein
MLLLSRRPANKKVGDDRVIELGLGLEGFLPTGDPDELLGRGETQLRAMAFGSATRSRVSPHFNLGYTFGGDGVECDPAVLSNCLPRVAANALLTSSFGFIQQPSPEINYTVGADVFFADTTVSTDVIGRALRNAAEFGFYTRDVFGLQGSGFTVSKGTVNLLLLGISAKRLIGQQYLLTFSLLAPLTDNGIKPGLVPSIALERSF